MTDSLTRRGFVGGSAAVLGFALSGAGSLAPFSREAAAATRPGAGYGPLQYTPGAILALPRGFRYTVIAEAGKPSGGIVQPSDPDAMGVFDAGRGATNLISNHEVGGSEPYPVPHERGLVYDPGARGGTTTFYLDARNQVRQHYPSLGGTLNNCAGGVTPWQTWLTCEETEARAGGALTKDHGYVFEVDPRSQQANAGRSPIPLKFLGRYAHEAVAVDPWSSQIYLTEDAGNPNGLYYRWTPPRGFRCGKGALHRLAKDGAVEVGTLEAMRCVDSSGRHVTDLAQATKPNTRYRVEWVKVPDRDARTLSVRKQFREDQITRSRKLEGQWWGDGGVYFVASFARRSDGSVNEHDGQVWFYDPRRRQITLTTIFGRNPTPDSEGNNFDGPDNITVSPHGGLMLAEDGSGKQHLVGVTDQGTAYPMALNQVNDSEFCGPVFNKAGTTLFCNIQSGPGYTLAITGPWRRPSNGSPGRR